MRMQHSICFSSGLTFKEVFFQNILLYLFRNNKNGTEVSIPIQKQFI